MGLKSMDDRTRAKEADYGAKATAYCKQMMQGHTKGEAIFPIIKPDSAEWNAWERYFLEHLGFEPLAMKRVRWGMQQSMTVPSQWPEWFDNSYQAAA